MKITPKNTDTGLYVPVHRFEESPEPTEQSYPVHTETESWVNFWGVMLMAIATVGVIGWMWGWFKTPAQATIEKLEQTQQQLSETQAELAKIKSCIK